jgi:hypothetical protein
MTASGRKTRLLGIIARYSVEIVDRLHPALLFTCCSFRQGETRAGGVGQGVQSPCKVTHVLPYKVLELRYYLTAGGESPFESWFSDLDAAAAAKASLALVRLEQGNTSNAKTVGEGVLEYRIDGGLATGFI